mmetsp:Transcript_2196/g.4192  ORF Transcript_2196/g.4192 Transcript_2196/m.4192 type:complete len:106 (-) Transcript_2196:226-543(-)
MPGRVASKRLYANTQEKRESDAICLESLLAPCQSELHPRESWSSRDRYDRCDAGELEFLVPKSAGTMAGSVGVVAYMALPPVPGQEDPEREPRRWSGKEQLSLSV